MHVEQPLIMRDRPLVGRAHLCIREVADVLAEEGFAPAREAKCALELRTARKHRDF